MGKKVYIAIVGEHYEGSEILGVASSKDKAQDILDKNKEEQYSEHTKFIEDCVDAGYFKAITLEEKFEDYVWYIKEFEIIE